VLYLGPSPDNERHRHHAAQICVSLQGRLRVDAGSHAFEPLGILVPPDCPHRINAGDASILALYLEPESDDYASLLAPWLKQHDATSVRTIDPPTGSLEQLRNIHASSGDPHQAWSACASALGMGVTNPSPLLRDPRIAQVIDIIRRQPSASHGIDALAGAVHLSPSRLSHLFRNETGIAIRRFIVWVRIRQVVERALDGASLTQAAHAAGFADAAHMSNTFRQMFGFAPSTLFSARIEKDVQLLD